MIFLKPPSSLLAPEDPIVLPPEGAAHRLRRRTRGHHFARVLTVCADGADLRPYIAGYTLLNDVSARDYQALDKQWTRAKSFDTFCPLGPVMETEFDVAHGTHRNALEWI